MSAFRHPVTVVKLGGSVLTSPAAYRRAAGFIAARLVESPGERVLAVVSAEYGATDALLSEAREIAGEPDRATLDLLWSTGETRSAALLTLHLHAMGVAALALNAHQTGLEETDNAGAARVRALRLRAALAGHDVVVAPGFVARGAADRIVSLGRGGSDLTAVLIAAGLGAGRCELVKDVAGYYSADPRTHAEAEHLPSIGYARALAMADDGCDLVQRAALEAARDRRVPLVVRTFEGAATTVG